MRPTNKETLYEKGNIKETLIRKHYVRKKIELIENLSVIASGSFVKAKNFGS